MVLLENFNSYVGILCRLRDLHNRVAALWSKCSVPYRSFIVITRVMLRRTSIRIKKIMNEISPFQQHFVFHVSLILYPIIDRLVIVIWN